VFREKWLELQVINDEFTVTTVAKAYDEHKELARTLTSKTATTTNEALLLRMVVGFRLFWERVLSDPVDPFSSEAQVEVSQHWLDEWYTRHEVRSPSSDTLSSHSPGRSVSDAGGQDAAGRNDGPLREAGVFFRFSAFRGNLTVAAQVDYWFWNK
jgi:hypothetical protein